MMFITYAADIEALINYVQTSGIIDKYPKQLSWVGGRSLDGKPNPVTGFKILINKVPTFYNADHSISLIDGGVTYDEDGNLTGLFKDLESYIDIIGKGSTCEDAYQDCWSTKAGRDKYDLAYPRTNDDEGKLLPRKKFGVLV